ncbi:MAG: hypothetical protein KTR31_31710 [Myxococcales bacterium]|nr:hypothetical protein [Myxococcales bacterium]
MTVGRPGTDVGDAHRPTRQITGSRWASQEPSVVRAAEMLGMARRGRRWGPCPACGAETSSRERRGCVAVWRGDRAWFCNACQSHGDACDLVGHVHPDWTYPERRAFLEGESGGACAAPRTPPIPARIPRAELEQMLAQCVPVHHDDEVATYLEGRNVEPALAPALAVPRGYGCRWWPRRWSKTWRLLVPAFTGRGELVSVQARAVSDAPIKTRWPCGFSSAGALFADERALSLLRRGPAPETLVIAEGLTDFVAASANTPDVVGVLSVTSGSADALRLVTVPPDLRVVVATDFDETGNGYASKVAAALAPHPTHRFRFDLAT